MPQKSRMQWLYILRGRFVAYGVAVVVIGGITSIAPGNDASLIAIVAIFGLFAMIPFMMIAFVIWLMLAANRVHVRAWQAVAICSGAFFVMGVFGAIADADGWTSVLVALGTPILGAALGAVFWVGAFGFRRKMQMGTRMPEEW
jgi:hypothetical protein